MSRVARNAVGAGTLATALLGACGDGGSGAADASQAIADARPEVDAAVSDAALADAALADAALPDAAVPLESKRALWHGDFITDGTEQIALYDGSDNSIVELTTPGVTSIDNVHTVVPSPDGTQIALAIEHDGLTPKLYVANLDGSGTPVEVADLGDPVLEFSEVHWSPDATRLAYIADGTLNNARRAYVVPVDGSAPPAIVSQDPKDAARDVASLAWFDNTRVVYRADLVVDGVDNFYTSDITLSPPAPVPLVPENLLSNGAEVRESAEVAGGTIYFKSNHEGAFRLYTVDPDGQNLAVETSSAALSNGLGTAEVGAFRLSPDKTQIAFGADSPTAGLYQVFVADLGGVAQQQSNVTLDPPAKGALLGPVFGPAIRWSADGSLLAVIADWPVNAGDADNDQAAFVVPATGAAGGVRIWHGPIDTNQDVASLDFTSDSSTLIGRGDLVINNDTELFVTTDFTTPDQALGDTLLQGVGPSGDVIDFRIIP